MKTLYWSWGLKSVLSGMLVCAALTACTSPALFNSQDSTIYKTQNRQRLSFSDMLQELAAYDMILVGEKHDDIRHHQAQLALLQGLQRRRALASVVLEMVPRSHQPAFYHGQTQAQGLAHDAVMDSERLRQILQWPEQWAWAQYASLVSWMVREGLPMYGANLDDAEIATIARGAQPLRGTISTAPQVRRLLADLMRGHHAQTDEQLQAQVQIQQFRDRRMAESMVRSRKPAVLFAGNVHVSRTMGVPLHLQDYGQSRFASIMLVSSERDIDPKQADYFWVIR